MAYRLYCKTSKFSFGRVVTQRHADYQMLQVLTDSIPINIDLWNIEQELLQLKNVNLGQASRKLLHI